MKLTGLMITFDARFGEIKSVGVDWPKLMMTIYKERWRQCWQRSDGHWPGCQPEMGIPDTKAPKKETQCYAVSIAFKHNAHSWMMDMSQVNGTTQNSFELLETVCHLGERILPARRKTWLSNFTNIITISINSIVTIIIFFVKWIVLGNTPSYIH